MKSKKLNLLLLISLMCYVLQGNVQQYQLYHIRSVSSERNVITEKARHGKGEKSSVLKAATCVTIY